jgi:hypothetical protein
MNTRLIMMMSAIYLGVLGIIGSFLPHEILAWLGEPPSGSLALVIQICGASLFGFAMVNWMAKESLIGGIYNRPVAIGNVAHFTIGALALLRAATASAVAGPLLAAVAGHVLFAVAFALILFTSPVKQAAAVR